MTIASHNLHALFCPKTVAVVGASDNPAKLGFHVMKSLTQGGFAGRIFPINPTANDMMGLPAFGSLQDTGESMDLAIVVVPAPRVPQVFTQCAQTGVKGIVLITAGFREIEDPEGARRHEEIKDIADRAGIPVIGPNTFGMIHFHSSLNASFTPEFSLIPEGGVSLVSQSGGMSHLLGFLAIKAGIGFSHIVGLGNRLNVDFADVILYLADDPDTRVIVLYVEGIDDPRRLMQAARSIANKKPILAYKTGSGKTGDQASLSHTGSLAGRHQIYMDSFRQAGILPIHEAETLLDTARALCNAPLLQGPNVAILSGQAGPSMAACDVCEAGGLQILPFSPETQNRINLLLPPLAMRTNPVDMGPAWYDASAIRGIIETVMEAEEVHGILLLMMFASANRGALEGFQNLLLSWGQKKPLLACIQAPPGIWDHSIQHLEEAGAMVNFPTPERAARAMNHLYRVWRMQSQMAGQP